MDIIAMMRPMGFMASLVLTSNSLLLFFFTFILLRANHTFYIYIFDNDDVK